MARLLTSGAGTQAAVSEGVTSSGTLTFDTTTVNPLGDGTSFNLATASPRVPITGGALGRGYYLKWFGYIASLPSPGPANLVLQNHGGGTNATLKLYADGSLGVEAATTVTTGAGAVGLGWNLIEWYFLMPASGTAGTTALRVGAATVLSSTTITTGTNAPVTFNFTANNGAMTHLDDIALNDDQGASQNSWPGDGRVVMLKPKADSARGANWLAGAGATTNLWDAVDNTPPVGVVLGSATNTSQVKNAAKDTVGLYDVSVEAYDVAVASGGGGIATADTITLVQPVAAVGASGAAIVHGLAGASNPVIAEATVTTSASAAGTFPSNWISLPGTVTYAPTPTRATRPVIRLRKGTSSTTAAMAAFMGLLVEYVPAAVATPMPPRPTIVQQAVQRAAVR